MPAGPADEADSGQNRGMTHTRAVHHLAVLRECGDAILAGARPDLDRAVPACPGWDLRRLIGHIGRIFHNTIGHLPRGVTTPPNPTPRPPSEDGALLDYYAEGLAGVLLTLDAVDPGRPAFNYWPQTEQVAGFWRRRLAQEVVVHHFDVEQAWGRDWAIAPEVAADGVDEVLTVFLPRTRTRAAGAGDVPLRDGSVHVHLTDVDGEWLTRLAGGTVEVTHGHEKGDAVLRGEASPALLALWGRVELDSPGIEVIGDPDLVRALSPGV